VTVIQNPKSREGGEAGAAEDVHPTLSRTSARWWGLVGRQQAGVGRSSPGASSRKRKSRGVYLLTFPGKRMANPGQASQLAREASVPRKRWRGPERGPGRTALMASWDFSGSL